MEEESQANDKLFEPSVEMLVNDFDEEGTLEEEEALAAKEQQNPEQELSDLQRESEMSIEELLKLYGCGTQTNNFVSSSSGSTSRKRRRNRNESSEASSTEPNKKQIQDSVAEDNQSSSSATTTAKVVENVPEISQQPTTSTVSNNNEDAVEIPDDDETINQSVSASNETNHDDDEEEPSALKRLYDTSDDDEDLDYIPVEEEGKKKIMIGPEHQAYIPEGLLQYDDALPYENEDKLLWDPTKLSDDDIEEYLNKFSAAQDNETKHLRDDIQALLLLLQCGNNCEEALRRQGIGAVQPVNTMSIWSEEECRNFENGLRLYGKNFREIQGTMVRTRSVSEIVEFYYLWKKTERADQFVNKARLDKKKYNPNPCVTDFMDKYLEECDNTGGARDRSVSPNINNSNSLLLSDTKHRLDCGNSLDKEQAKVEEGGTNAGIKIAE